jgi:hypothetical protein
MRAPYSMFFAALALLACGCKRSETARPETTVTTLDAAPPPPKVLESCDQRIELGVCVDYTKTDVRLHRALCEGYKGVFAEAPCSRERALGSCAMEDGEFKRYYEKAGTKGSGYTAEKARENCESEMIRGKYSKP